MRRGERGGRSAITVGGSRAILFSNAWSVVEERLTHGTPIAIVPHARLPIAEGRAQLTLHPGAWLMDQKAVAAAQSASNVAPINDSTSGSNAITPTSRFLSSDVYERFSDPR